MVAARTNTHTRRLRFTDAYSRRISTTRDAAEARLSRSPPAYDEPSSRIQQLPKYDARDMKREKPRRGSSGKFSPIVPGRRAPKSGTALGVKCRRLRFGRQGYQFWDFENYLAETDDQNEIKALYTNEPQSYGNLISQYRKDGAIWTPSYYQYDALGSARALTDDAGDATDTYVYNAWGNEVAVSGSTVNPFRWVGQVGYYWDEGSGTFYIRARVYEPVTGTWMSQDPLFYPLVNRLRWRGLRSANSRGYSTFAYSSLAPVVRLDPRGTQEEDGCLLEEFSKEEKENPPVLLQLVRTNDCTKCPCIQDPRDCSISVDFLAEGTQVRIRFDPADIGEEDPTYNQRVFNVPTRFDTMSDTRRRRVGGVDHCYFHEVISALVMVKSKSGKDVTNCVLEQHVVHSFRRHLDGSALNLGTGLDLGPANDRTNYFYGGWWIYDEPSTTMGYGTNPDTEPQHIFTAVFKQFKVTVLGTADRVKAYWGVAIRADYEQENADVSALRGKHPWGPVAVPKEVPACFGPPSGS